MAKARLAEVFTMPGEKAKNMNATDRFVDQKLTIADFMDEYLVICPQCEACASVKLLPGGEDTIFSPRRLTCAKCGLVKDKKPERATIVSDGGPVDGYFHLPLWLVTSQGIEDLWAYNLRHLEYIESFVRASHRTRQLDVPGCLNCSIISRLPRWIKKGSNRKRVLSLIQKLKDSVK